MPTNLPPDYFTVEKQYRAAASREEKIAYLEEMMRLVPKHKGTDRLRADLRKRLSELRSASESRKGPSRQVSAYHIDREGAGQVAVIGPANTGKSALVQALTNAEPEVAAYPFTTWTPTPGMMLVKKVQIQLIDTPPLNGEYVDPELIALIRRADLLLLMLDLQTYPIEQLEETMSLLGEHRIGPPHMRSQVAEPQRWWFLPTLVVVNKTDDEMLDEDFEVLQELLGDEWTLLPLSITEERYIERLKETIFERLEIIRVYSKPPGKPTDLSAPFVMKKGGTVEEFAGQIHRDLLEKLQSARIWGTGVYDGQMVGRDHVLHDGDIVELRT
ncbi:MAG: GTPase [Anaerolineae bacterium]